MYLKKFNLKNKTALVTKAEKGIGRACAITLAEEPVKYGDILLLLLSVPDGGIQPGLLPQVSTGATASSGTVSEGRVKRPLPGSYQFLHSQAQ